MTWGLPEGRELSRKLPHAHDESARCTGEKQLREGLQQQQAAGSDTAGCGLEPQAPFFFPKSFP